MKIIKLGLVSIFSACLFTPAITQAGNYEEAVKNANASLDKAKAANYEWRDSRKLLKKAEKLNKEGKSKKAMKLVTKAKKQGELAVAQAKSQSNVTGPHQ